VRGKGVSDLDLSQLYDDIMKKTNHSVDILFKMDYEELMAVGLKVKFYWYQIGSGGFLNSFFSTVAYHLEDRRWGSRFPVIMNDLYKGMVAVEDVPQAISELHIIEKELKKVSPNQVIWDIEDLSKRPPWGDDISADITSLSNYFVTNEGKDLLATFCRALEKAQEVNSATELLSK